MKKPATGIQMVDVQGQYLRLKENIDHGIQEVIDQASFINGRAVKTFSSDLGVYLDGSNVIPCGNGTDALQIALMALDLKPNDQVMIPAFTYAATAEVIALLGLLPVMVDVDPQTFNLTSEIVAENMTESIRAIVPVNLFGQCAELEPIMKLAVENDAYVVEDNAQAIGSEYILESGEKVKAGTIGHIGCTSFYPSKNLGAFGDGGAMYTHDAILAERLKMITNHGQSKKYIHDIIGCNSRLDSIQAAILKVKLRELDDFNNRRQMVADRYDLAFLNNDYLEIPKRAEFSTHVFHQYTVKVKDGRRDELKSHLIEKGIPSMIYYPIPLYNQKAYAQYFQNKDRLPHTELICKEVLSLPIHTEMQLEEIAYITYTINQFFKN